MLGTKSQNTIMRLMLKMGDILDNDLIIFLEIDYLPDFGNEAKCAAQSKPILILKVCKLLH